MLAVVSSMNRETEGAADAEGGGDKVRNAGVKWGWSLPVEDD